MCIVWPPKASVKIAIRSSALRAVKNLEVDWEFGTRDSRDGEGVRAYILSSARAFGGGSQVGSAGFRFGRILCARLLKPVGRALTMYQISYHILNGVWLTFGKVEVEGEVQVLARGG